MNVADHAIRTQDADKRHTSEFKKIDFLFIALCHRATWIGQPDKWKFFLRPIFEKLAGRIRTDCQNLGATFCEFIVIISQAR